MPDDPRDYVLKTPFDTAALPREPDAIAPDGSEIRLLPAPRNGAGSMAHCTLRPGQVSKAVRHRTVEEVWHFLSGRGELWRASGDVEEELLVHPGMSVTIPLGTRFQFRTVGGEALVFVLVTTPPWPGDDEAVHVTDHWPPTPPAARSGRGGA